MRYLVIKFKDGQTGQLLSRSELDNSADNIDYFDRPCVLLTEGTFQSMDGEVTINPEHIVKMAEVFNAKIEKIKASGREPVMSDFQPAQVDHLPGAFDTVGRLIGPLKVEVKDGKQTLFGVIRFLGKENIERAKDGRFTHLSVGIDSLKSCELDEISITPFPACKNAILLSNKGACMTEEEKKKKAEEEAKLAEEEKAKEEEEAKKLAAEEEEKKKLAEGDKAHEDAESKKKEEEEEAAVKAKKKLEEDEEKDDKKKLGALLVGIKAKQDGMRLAIKQSNIKVRLSTLRANAKITPAEMKKLDVVRLAKASDETIAAVLESYENRQPVILTPVYSTVNAVNPAVVAQEIRMSELENETRKHLKSVPQKVADKTNQGARLADIKEPAENTEEPHTDLWDEIVKCIKAGDENTAKEMYRKMRGAKLEGESCESTEMEMKKLMADMAALDSDYSEVVRLATITSGIKI